MIADSEQRIAALEARLEQLSAEVKQLREGANTKATPPRRWWTISEAIQYTGLTYWQLRYATRHGRIRSEQLGGGVILLDPDEVTRFASMKAETAERQEP